MREVNVALIGYAFMGRAHSNAWRQVSRFLSPKLTPRLKVLCGRGDRDLGVAVAGGRHVHDVDVGPPVPVTVTTVEQRAVCCVAVDTLNEAV